MLSFFPLANFSILLNILITIFSLVRDPTAVATEHLEKNRPRDTIAFWSLELPRPPLNPVVWCLPGI